MFMARAELFKMLPQLNIHLDDFPIPITNKKSEHVSQLAHVMERLLGYAVYYRRYILFDGTNSIDVQQTYHKNIYLWYLIGPIIRFFFQKKITKSGKTIIKICKVPVYRSKS